MPDDPILATLTELRAKLADSRDHATPPVALFRGKIARVLDDPSVPSRVIYDLMDELSYFHSFMPDDTEAALEAKLKQASITPSKHSPKGNGGRPVKEVGQYELNYQALLAIYNNDAKTVRELREHLNKWHVNNYPEQRITEKYFKELTRKALAKLGKDGIALPE